MYQTLFVTFLLITSHIFAQDKNVCKTTKDYNSIEGNSNCWYDPAANSTVPKIIEYWGRPVEEHKVITNDGYILTMFRLPNHEGRKVSVFLQHGLITTSANWLSLGNDSLAFQLYDIGYDVWMGNYRGTQYSNKHLNLTEKDDAFWNYSMDEVALRDLPAMFKKITEITGRSRNIIYIGHSLGTTFTLMYSADMPQEAKNYLKFQILTAPAYTLNHLRSLLRIVAPFADPIYSLVGSFPRVANLISKGKTSNGLLKLVCTDSAEMMQGCMKMFFLLYGIKTEVLPEKYPLFFHQHFRGTAWKLFKHVSDLARNRFRKFDYGYSNKQRYGSLHPPSYDISKITIPTVVIFARNDRLTPKEDAINLYQKLPPGIRKGIYEVREENFNHIDFMMGKKANSLYVNKVIEILNTKIP